jgi:hypothetical protein
VADAAAAVAPGVALAAAIRESTWLFPVAETIHIVGIALLVGSVVAFDLRVLGVSRALPVRGLARHLLPWSLASLALIVPSGLVMFLAQPELIGNRAFLVKLGLLGLAAINAIVFHTGPYAGVAAWDRDVAAPAGAKAIAALSILLWIAVIAAGRMIAYV